MTKKSSTVAQNKNGGFDLPPHAPMDKLAKLSAFHAGDRGSNPLGSTIRQNLLSLIKKSGKPNTPQQEGLGVDCKPLNNPYLTETGDDDNKGVRPTQMSNMAP